ncbi:hypothetical protein [Neorhizobium sp. DT-125]|uniref:hypothetical protein n=1 Tax=Neorhizobium sp. DT-125 TaxID=3396163 RepID=UPI003F1D1350
MKQGAFSEVVAAVIAAEYDRAPSYRRIISAAALSRMEETWGWINGHFDEVDCKLVLRLRLHQEPKGHVP